MSTAESRKIWELAGGAAEDVGAIGAGILLDMLSGERPLPGVAGGLVAIVGTGPSINRPDLIDEIMAYNPSAVVGLNGAAAWVGSRADRIRAAGAITVGRYQDAPADLAPTRPPGLDLVIAMAGYHPVSYADMIVPCPYPIGPMASAPCAVVEARASGAASIIFFACDSVAGDHGLGCGGASDPSGYARYAAQALAAAGPVPCTWRCPSGIPDVSRVRLAVHHNYLGDRMIRPWRQNLL
jgi:hypothetical protein